MPSMTNAMCGIDRTLLAERADIQPFQGWGTGMPPTQGGASLTLGFNMEPPWGSRPKPRRVILQKSALPASRACQPAGAVASSGGAGASLSISAEGKRRRISRELHRTPVVVSASLLTVLPVALLGVNCRLRGVAELLAR